MIEQDSWVRFQEIDWNCPNFNRFNVDTRDFHVGYQFKDEEHKDFSKLKKYIYFFFTEIELISLLTRLFKESGGKGGWRYLELEGDTRVKNWNLKYLRIFRCADGRFIVCNSDNVAIPKYMLDGKINKELLCYQIK